MPLRGIRGTRPARPAASLAVLVTVLLLATACGSTGVGSGPYDGDDRAAPPLPPSRQPVPTAGPTPVPVPVPGVVRPVAGARERRVAWRLVRALRGPAVLVEVQVGGAPCDVVTGVDVTESDRAVRLVVWAGREPRARCAGPPAMLGTFRLRVPLGEPLRTRPLE